MEHRLSNPFATKFLQPSRSTFTGIDEVSLDRLARLLIRQNGEGQIVGPHGVGKTTLSFELDKRVHELTGGVQTFKFVRRTVGFRGAVRCGGFLSYETGMKVISESKYSNDDSSSVKRILVIDGFERLSCFQRLALRDSCRRKRIGLLLTSHRRIWGVPVLIELKPDLSKFKSVFEMLTAGYDFQLSAERLREIFYSNEQNLREALMSCYDEFELSRAKTACLDLVWIEE